MSPRFLTRIIAAIRWRIAAFRHPPKRQFGTLCWRRGAAGLEILLITTRRTGRWSTPKGNLMRKHGPQGTAIREAWEEAGARGQLSESPLGVYHALKIRPGRRTRALTVEIYGLEVTTLAEKFPESGQRRLAWMTPEAAAKAVSERGLEKLVENLARSR